jgi:hypothetical protein
MGSDQVESYYFLILVKQSGSAVRLLYAKRRVSTSMFQTCPCIIFNNNMGISLYEQRKTVERHGATVQGTMCNSGGTGELVIYLSMPIPYCTFSLTVYIHDRDWRDDTALMSM